MSKDFGLYDILVTGAFAVKVYDGSFGFDMSQTYESFDILESVY